MAYTWREEDRYPLGNEDRYRAFREGTFNAEGLRLSRLSDLDNWQVAEGEPDIRGWNILDRDDNQIAQVQDLIASPVDQRVYFILAQYGGALGIGGKHVLVPLDVVHLNRDDQQVRLNATRDDMENAPQWKKDGQVDYVEAWRYWQDRIGMFTAEGTEASTRTTTAAPRERELAGMRGGETRVPLRGEELVTQREQHAGEVVIEKHVVSEQRDVEVPITHTEVEVERRTVTGAARGHVEGQMGESEVRIPVMEEETHLETRPVVNEEIIVRQHPVTETEHQKATVRREVAEVHKEGDVDVETKGDIHVK